MQNKTAIEAMRLYVNHLAANENELCLIYSELEKLLEIVKYDEFASDKVRRIMKRLEEI